jgi:RimJ/RimL family protein N-acetyltransferase
VTARPGAGRATNSSGAVSRLGEREEILLHGPRVVIRCMRRADLDAMAEWRPFADPLYQPFDFPLRGTDEYDEWFDWRSKDPTRRLFTILDECRQVIGSLTLREVRDRSARLGITIGADYVSRGYGSEALHLFLDSFFGSMGFEEMKLDVAATNLRALRIYRALGFREVGQHYRPADHPSYRELRNDPRYQHLHDCFRRVGNGHEVLFYDMVMTRALWQSGASRNAGKAQCL